MTIRPDERDEVYDGATGQVLSYQHWPATSDGTVEEGTWDGSAMVVSSRLLEPAEVAIFDGHVAQDEARAKSTAVDDAVATLRDWADDAEATTVTSGNAVATLQTVVTRLGVFFDRFADLVESDKL